MKGIILHGGSGTRLRPLTYTDVKQLLPIAGKPVSEYALENLKELGIKDINIIIGEIGGNEVKEYYGNGSKWGLNTSYTYQGKPLGIAHAISLVKDFILDDDFVVVLGDNYFQNGLKPLFEEFLKQKCDSFVALTHVSNPRQFGVAEVNGGKIVKLVEKPKEPKSNLAIAGAYFLKPVIFDVISELKPSWRNELEITEAFQLMIERGMNVGYSVIDGWWKDTGTAEEFLECNRLVLDRIEPKARSKEWKEGEVFGRVYLGNNVVIRGKSRVIGPSFIGDNTVIDDSYIGPFSSIGKDCNIVKSEIEDSVIMDGCSIYLENRRRIRNSMLGPNTCVSSLNNDLEPVKLILGRDSKITL